MTATTTHGRTPTAATERPDVAACAGRLYAAECALHDAHAATGRPVLRHPTHTNSIAIRCQFGREPTVGP